MRRPISRAVTQFAERLAATLLIGLFVSLGVAAQDTQPAWLQIQRADRLSDDGEYGRAMQLYREALVLDPGSAEAVFGLARAFKAVGDYLIAEEYLQDSLAAADRLFVPAMRYEINYELSDLYRVQRRFSDYQEILFDLIALSDSEPVPPRTITVPSETLQRVFLDNGLDRLLLLYRLELDGATRARGELCELMVGLGRYDAAVEFGLVAVVEQLSTVIEAVIDRDPDYEFESVRMALAAAENYPETREYLADTTLYRNLYFLGSALYSGGARQPAMSVWSLVSALPGAQRWADRARIQLGDPQQEPLLVPPE
jgi:tetratricopeptide (TPR) repeat protein